jgi:hypothetical protein
MLTDAFSAFLFTVPQLFGATICFIVLLGFWRGLSLRPHEPDQRAPARMWWGGEV